MSGLASISVRFTADLKEFSTKMQSSVRSLKKMGKQLKSVGKTLSIGVTAPFVAAGFKALQTASNFEQLEGRLKTAFQGSEDAAKKAFNTIIDFTSKTPFQVEEVADAFVKLKNLGLEPSENALTSYGNTAAAMGKSLNQLIEAVADSATGEFERLKEFGIKSKSQGDQVSFTFQGITKTVGKNASEITKYLQDLGNVNFAGAMDELSTTFEGNLSNLKDSLSLLANEFGKILIGYIKPFISKLKEVVTVFKNLHPETKTLIILVASLASVVGPLLIALGFMMTTVVPGLITSFGYLRSSLLLLQTGFLKLTAIIAANPFGALAVAIAAIGSYFIFFNRETTKTIENQTELSKINDTAAKSIANEKAKLQELLFIAKNENIQKSARIKAVQELNKISPKYLGNLTLETINTDKAREALALYNLELIKTAKIKAAQSKLQELQSKIIDIELSKEAQSVSIAKEKLKIQEDTALSAADKNKLLGVANQSQKLGNILNDKELQGLKDQENQLLKIIAANQTLNKVVSSVPTSGTGRKKQTAISTDLKPIGVSLDIANPLNAEAEKVDGTLQGINKSFKDFSEQSSQIITGAANNALAGFGVMIAGLASGSLTLGDVAGGLLSIVGDMATQLGKAAIEIGIGMLAIKTAFTNPFTAIAAGVALVAVGALISSAAQTTSGGNYAGAFANGGVAGSGTGIVGGTSFSGDKLFARINSGEMVLNQRQQSNVAGLIGAGGGQNVEVVLQPSIDFVGDKFRVMLNKVDQKFSRRK